ncbi:MAG: hypothetical protein Q7R64_02490 [bacterium]|nr:hypothetical protein [bacterium]
MQTQWKTTFVESVRPEYFFWFAMVGVFFLFLFPQGAEPAVAHTGVASLGTLTAPRENPYEKLELLGRAGYVYDLKNKKVLFEKNADDILPLASITKIMTAITALSLVPETTDITISSDALKVEGDSGLKVGERWLLRDLLAFTLIGSSNDGAVAISSAIGGFFATSTPDAEASRARFIGEMNRLARAIGLTSTTFLNETGLDVDTERAGAYSSAKETASLLAYALTTTPEIFTGTRFDALSLGTEEGEKRSTKNTNTETHRLPLLIASKTGYTDLAGGNLVIAFDAGFGHTIIISVLGSTVDGRFADVEKLVWATLEYINRH